MINQAILRFVNTSDDVECYVSNEGLEYEKIISKDTLIEALTKELLNKPVEETKIDMLGEYDRNCLYIAYSEHHKKIIYNFTERKIKCQFDKKGYNINHPNSIMVINEDDGSVSSIEAYCYKEFKGKSTKLYKYPFANMLGANSMCLGTTDKNYTTPLKAILTAVEANYTHHYTGFTDKKFHSTKNLFEYLKKHKFPYGKLMPLNKEIKDLER